MSFGLTHYLGNSATLSSGAVSFNISELTDVNGNALIADIPNATESQIMLAIIGHLWNRSRTIQVVNGVEVQDKTMPVVGTESFQPKTFEVREDESQVRHEFIFNCYTVDETDFDPDNAV